MPRIEINPQNTQELARGDGAPTKDICWKCAAELSLSSDIVTLDCEHPTYNLHDYHCEFCNKLLTELDD